MVGVVGGCGGVGYFEFQVVIVFVDYGGSRIVVFVGVVLVVVLF